MALFRSLLETHKLNTEEEEQEKDRSQEMVWEEKTGRKALQTPGETAEFDHLAGGGGTSREA